MAINLNGCLSVPSIQTFFSDGKTAVATHVVLKFQLSLVRKYVYLFVTVDNDIELDLLKMLLDLQKLQENKFSYWQSIN